MKAVVLGGGGLTGRCSVRDLASSGMFDEVVAADLDRGLADAAAKAAGSAPGPSRSTSATGGRSSPCFGGRPCA